MLALVGSLIAFTTTETVVEQPELNLKIVPGFSVDHKDPPQDCHYADPWKQSCKSDELAATIQAKPTPLKICVSKCSSDSDCPTDVCPGVTSSPRCFLQDASGQKYAASLAGEHCWDLEEVARRTF